ncbi:Zinc finger, CCHC-type superfamily [Sesbania bispinosa]|nr:Zinc finger, CCHC-type superfamily [Sesbania bispinosa]
MLVRMLRILSFLKILKNLIYGNFTREKFEDEWNRVVEKHGLRENRWVRKVYELKRMWATAYLRDNFFARIRTTSICKGINSFIKRYVQSKNSLVDFLHNFERAVNEYKHNELSSDFKSTYTQPVMTTALEKYELENVVQLDKSSGNLICDRRLFESCGIPCSHIFSAMKHEQIESIPASLICKRWTRLVKVDHIFVVHVEEGDTSNKDLLRSGAVGAACNRLNKVARKNPHNFVKNIESIHKLAEQMEREEGIDLNDNVDISRVVCDPTVVKTKGAPRKNKKMSKKGRCSYCKRPGHTVRTCKKYATRDQLDIVLEEKSSVETDEESRDQSVSVNPRFSQDLNDVSIFADHNRASDKGQSKKKKERNEEVNTTHESGMRSKFNTKSDFNVNQMSTPSLFDNHVYVSNMNAPSMSGPVHFRPLMIHGFGEGLSGNRFQYMSQYRQMYMRNTVHTPPIFSNVNPYGNRSQFISDLNPDETHNGLGRMSFSHIPRDDDELQIESYDHDDNYHWYLVVLDFMNKEVVYLDSFPSVVDEGTRLRIALVLTLNPGNILQEEILDRVLVWLDNLPAGGGDHAGTA